MTNGPPAGNDPRWVTCENGERRIREGRNLWIELWDGRVARVRLAVFRGDPASWILKIQRVAVCGRGVLPAARSATRERA